MFGIEITGHIDIVEFLFETAAFFFNSLRREQQQPFVTDFFNIGAFAHKAEIFIAAHFHFTQQLPSFFNLI